MYITGGGAEPECLAKILELSGLTPVNGFKTNCPEDELALVIIDCGGTLRCGIYPKKRIPTINTNPVGKSGPLAQFITEDIYVSGVTSKQVSLADETEAAPAEPAAPAEEKSEEKQDGVKFTADMKISETLAKQEKKSFITSIGLGVGKVVNTFYQAARDAVQTCITTLLPFMAFVSMLIGIINGSGFGNAFASILTPLTGNVIGLVILGIICSIPGSVRPARTGRRHRTDCRYTRRCGDRQGQHRPVSGTSGTVRHQYAGRLRLHPGRSGSRRGGDRDHRGRRALCHVLPLPHRLAPRSHRLRRKLRSVRRRIITHSKFPSLKLDCRPLCFSFHFRRFRALLLNCRIGRQTTDSHTYSLASGLFSGLLEQMTR